MFYLLSQKNWIVLNLNFFPMVKSVKDWIDQIDVTKYESAAFMAEQEEIQKFCEAKQL